MEKCFEYRKFFLILFICAFCIPSFIFLDGYRDDFGRLLHEQYPFWVQDGRPFIWSLEGRPVAQLIAIVVGFSCNFFNIAPLSQILSIIVISFSSILISERYFNKNNLIFYVVGGGGDFCYSIFYTKFIISV